MEAAIFSAFAKLAAGETPFVVFLLFYMIVDRMLGVWERRQSRRERAAAEKAARDERNEIERDRIKADKLLAGAMARLAARIEGAN